jgi:hypothetical protein
MASRMASDIWSATLSGCPSVTDSEVKRKFFTSILPLLPSLLEKISLIYFENFTRRNGRLY